jgi:uncharacterized Tic20 family protein
MSTFQPTVQVHSLPTQEERTWAALAHASILLFGFGSIAALLIWIAQRKKSAYVAFHALQALLYQTLEMVLFIFFGLVAGIFSFGLTILVAVLNRSNLGENSFLLVFAAEFIPLLIFLFFAAVYVAWAAVMAVLCLTGRSPRYPWIGSWLAKYLACTPDLVDERQERVTAAACHLGAYLNLYGMALPLIAWLSEKNRSAVLRFQGLQALLYQAIGLIAAVLYSLSMFALQIIFIVTLTFGIRFTSTNQNNNVLILLLILIPAVIMVLLTGLWVVVAPFYQTFPLLAAWQVSHSKDYRYPLLGKLIANHNLAKVPSVNLAKVSEPLQD